MKHPSSGLFWSHPGRLAKSRLDGKSKSDTSRNPRSEARRSKELGIGFPRGFQSLWIISNRIWLRHVYGFAFVVAFEWLDFKPIARRRQSNEQRNQQKLRSQNLLETKEATKFFRFSIFSHPNSHPFPSETTTVATFRPFYAMAAAEVSHRKGDFLRKIPDRRCSLSKKNCLRRKYYM